MECVYFGRESIYITCNHKIAYCIYFGLHNRITFLKINLSQDLILYVGLHHFLYMPDLHLVTRQLV